MRRQVLHISIRRALWERAGYRCERCGQSPSRLETHHVIPVKSGGSDELENLQCLCNPCHIEADAEVNARGRPRGSAFAKIVTVRLEKGQEAMLKAEAKRRGLSESEAMRQLIRQAARQEGIE